MWKKFPRASVGVGLMLGTLMCLAVSLAAFGGRWFWWLDLLAHGRPQYLVGAGMLMTIFLVKRKWRWAVMAGLACGLNAIVVLPYGVEKGEVVRQMGGRSDEVFKVATINLLQLGPPDRDYGKLRRDLEPWQPDVVALQEVGAEWAVEIELWKDWFPYRSLGMPVTRYHGLGLVSRVPWRRVERVVLGPVLITMGLAAELEVSGRVVSVLTVHALHPTDTVKVEILKSWHEAIVKWVKDKRSAGHAVIVMGDFNSTPWSVFYRDLVRATGLREAGRGHPFSATWRVGWPQQMMIDHVLYSDDWGRANWSVGEDFDSDHRPVLVEFWWR
ncbi:endonuclease/exonuclease/phosphatase family protein [Phragmitibacter flavus]|nr:endonuclease/exonuclease/phosphatase family protein [Phragmitibacter flavus]